MPNQFSEKLSTSSNNSFYSLEIAPKKVIRGSQVLQQAALPVSYLGIRPLLVSGKNSFSKIKSYLEPLLRSDGAVAPAVGDDPKRVARSERLHIAQGYYTPDCSESTLKDLVDQAKTHKADVIIGVGGGKALDTAKLVAYQLHIPVVTIPTSAATCAAWTALSNVYSEQGAFLYDVSLDSCPDLLILDYELIKTAPEYTLVAGIGDAIAKWYEASVSSGQSEETMVIAAVQQARVLRDILLQKSVEALKNPGSPVWQQVVDATVLLAGVIGGIGGAQCRTVAAHAVHNGLTHLCCGKSIHGEKVAYGILVQLRLEEMLQGNQLAASARQQLLKFYTDIGLPQNFTDLNLENITLAQLQNSIEIALSEKSDIHRLPFKVSSEQLMAAMVSTTAPSDSQTKIKGSTLNREQVERFRVGGFNKEVEK
ncbi:MAG: iron-containing alcohol dehydrogenase family protein [Cyanobacteria bacterium P01_A01_bin.45]